MKKNKDKENIFLLKLLEDPDTKVYEIIKEKILNDHLTFRPFLENYQIISDDKLAISRSDYILDQINYNEFELKLLDYVSKESHSLSQGAFLLETFFNKDISVEEIEAEFYSLYKIIWLEINYTLTSLEKVEIIKNILFGKLGFKINRSQNINPKDLSIYECLKTRSYISPSMALLYCIIAEKLNMPIHMLNIPGIFITGLFDDEIAKIVGSENDIALYIHPFDHGSILSDKTIKTYFKENNLKTKISDISRLTNIEFLLFIFNIRVNIIKKIKPERINFEQTKQIDKILKKLI